MSPVLNIIGIPATDIDHTDFQVNNDTIFVVYDHNAYTPPAGEQAMEPPSFLKMLRKLKHATCLFLAADEGFDNDSLRKLLTGARQLQTPFARLLIKYEVAPQYHIRQDGFVRSCIVPASLIKAAHLPPVTQGAAQQIYRVIYDYLKSGTSHNLEAVQVGKAPVAESTVAYREALAKAAVIMPHKGPLHLLKRSLNNLQHCADLPAHIRICFDDNSYKTGLAQTIPAALTGARLYRNEPLHCGPYPPRHYAIADNEDEFLYFCDSDDVPTINRFQVQQQELLEKGLDLIGSHELRVNEFNRKIEIHRFPLEVNAALAYGNFHPLLHPTSMIRRAAYDKTGGFSTDIKFGNDSQLLLRAYFFR